MIVILKQDARQEQVERLKNYLEQMGMKLHVSQGENTQIIGLIGDTKSIDPDLITSLDAVEAVRRIQEPYKEANRKFHPADTVVDCGGVKVGGGLFQVIAGPCSVENEEQIIQVAQAVKKSGATLLRGGAFKPRTSPYAFQGLHDEGLRLLLKAKQATGMPIVTELMDINHLPLFEDVDVIQVGARNMQNFEMLKALGHVHKPILLKRGLANTIQELLMSAEYILAGGNAGGSGGVTDIGIYLHQEVAAYNHRLRFGVVDVGRKQGASGSNLPAYKLRCDVCLYSQLCAVHVLANRHIFHFRRDDTLLGVVHLCAAFSLKSTVRQGDMLKTQRVERLVIAAHASILRRYFGKLFHIAALQYPWFAQAGQSFL